ncbi:MAG: hypothetical protein PGMFKBFP_00714 [Anaerolineales bacterium]|nr:hypothetical protein [Anaerolineales bacterium]
MERRFSVAFVVIKGLIIVLIRRMLSFSNIEALNGQLNVCSIMRRLISLDLSKTRGKFEPGITEGIPRQIA